MEEAVAAGGVEAVAAEKAEVHEGAEASVIETKGTEEEQETRESLDACFSKLIRGEMKNPYEKAFEVLHMDELIQGAMQYTAVRNIQARPDEGAVVKRRR